jgi:hypothetical protein
MKRPGSAVRARLSVEALEERQMLSGTPLSADADRSLTTPAAWWWYHGVSADFLSAQVQQLGARISDLQVESTSPYRFSATLIANTGDYGQAWWWYYGLTAGQLGDRINQNHACITDLDSYFVNGQRCFAAVLAPDTGTGAKAWWWYYDVSPSFVSDQLAQNGARPTDLEREDNGNLDVVMVANQGSDARTWWWYTGLSAADLSARLAQNHARLTDLDRQSDGNYSVITEQGQGEDWWYYTGQTPAQLDDQAGRNGARITDLQPYTVNGQQLFAGVMMQDTNPLTTQVGDILRGASDTVEVGAYLKQVDGAVLADLQGERRFEPASMIKVLIHVYAMRQVQAGRARLSDPITYYFDPKDPTNKDVNPVSYAHTPANAVVTTLEDALRRMMQNSDNRTTEAAMDHFGKANINAMAQALGLSDTVLGSPQPIGAGVPGNYFTLADAARLYEKVADGTAGITGATRDEFYALMLNGVDGTLAGVVLEEAAKKLNKPTTDPAVQALANGFIAQMRQAAKGGSYTLGADARDWHEDRTAGGWLALPFKSGGAIALHGYVYGMFVDDALNPTSNPDPVRQAIGTAMSQAEAALFRDQIDAALATW